MIPESLPLVYFGKLPARGDFVRARAHINETNNIDQWVSQALATSGAILEDHTVETNASKGAVFLNFSHVDTASKQIITGVLLPSYDSSHRSYPLIGFSLMYLEKPKNWTNFLPIKSLTVWDEAYKALAGAQAETNETQVTDDLNHCLLTIDKNASTLYYDFINITTLQDMATLMHVSKLQLIQQIIATGLLFLPTFSKGFNGLNKSICWTLTSDKASAIHIATFWHDLISGFYQPHQIYLNTYIYRVSDHYRLLLSFTKPDGHVLSQLSTQDETAPDDWVVIADSDWTQGYIDEDIGLTRFNKVLLQDDIYLYDTRQLFKKTFLAQ